MAQRKRIAGVLTVGAALLLAQPARASITLTAVNAYSTRTSGSNTYFAWPIRNTLTAAGEQEICGAAVPAAMTANMLYPPSTTALDPTSSSSILTFQIRTDTAYANVTRYIRAEIPNGSTADVPVRFDNGLLWTQYTGDPGNGVVQFGINLSDLCDKTGDAADCQFPQGTRNSIRLNIGIVQGQVSFDDATGSNGSSTLDYGEFFFDLVRCPTVVSSSYTGDITAGTARYTYSLSARPRDSSAVVTVGGEIPDVSADFPYSKMIAVIQASSTGATAPLNLSSATYLRELANGVQTGEFTVDNLENDRTYALQVAYVNVAGYITPPGPPNGDSTSPTVTPSEIAGALSKDAGCFIASVAYGEDSTMVTTLREFRDQVLLTFRLGREFVQWYYDWSVPAARWVSDHPAYRGLLRVALFPAVEFAAFVLWLRENLWVLVALFVVLTAGSVTMLQVSLRRKRAAKQGVS